MKRDKRSGASSFCARKSDTELGYFRTSTDAAITYAQHRIPEIAPERYPDAQEIVSHIVLPYGQVEPLT